MNSQKSNHYDAIVIGSGMGALSTATLLSKAGKKVAILEQNYLPGGCTSAYWRKGFTFEAGATTLVGFDNPMPIFQLCEKLNLLDLHFPLRPLTLPMTVMLKDGTIIKKKQSLEEWIQEAERVFGVKNQRAFWNYCFQISNFVWETSSQQLTFPPKNWPDLWNCIKNANITQVKHVPYTFFSMKWLLEKFDLLENTLFVEYINEQLLITAQNTIEEVNVLFGATAICYTNYNNYYVEGGLINLVQPLLEYVENHQGKVFLRTEAQKIIKTEQGYLVNTNKGNFRSEFIIFGIPINNALQIYEGKFTKKYKKKLYSSVQLNSAFQLGIGFVPSEINQLYHHSCIHHQIHLPEPLPYLNSKSIFISLSHPEDKTRSDNPEGRVASVSTHIADPANCIIGDKKEIEENILMLLDQKNIIKRKDIVYYHSSTQQSWQKWTAREYGFVGGYPQMMRIKPWQMIEARLDNHKAYLCGDSTYPGQGIPGVVLSGMIAFEKLKRDWLK
ncbi:MAG: FAD-binding protein [Cytophagales bacterium]|nr:MAG: FAD-binding protein [Cytophagales bacterium]